MKKIITILTTFILVLTLSACNTNNEKEQNTTNKESIQDIVQDSSFKATIKPLELSEEANKVFQLINNDHTQFYDLDIQNGEDKTVNISLYLYKDNRYTYNLVRNTKNY